MQIAVGARIGAYLVLVDTEGLRHAVRVGSVLAASDADSNQDLTVLQLPAGRCILVRVSLEHVLAWLA
jgi:hypothetical protein